MTAIGIVFRLMGLTDFMMDANIKYSYSGRYIYLINSVLLWINICFMLVFSLKEYNMSIFIKLFILLFITIFANAYPNKSIVSFVFPVMIILFTKFDFFILRRLLFICIFIPVIEILIMFCNKLMFNLSPDRNSFNLIYTIVFDVQLFTWLILLCLFDKKQMIKLKFLERW